MGNDDFMERLCSLQRIPHPNRRGDGNAVIRKCYSAGFRKRTEVCECFALLTYSDSTNGKYTAGTLRLALFQHIVHLLGGVQHRLCVGHTGNRSESACCGCCTACDDILLVGKAGVTEMHMHVHQTGGNDLSGAVDGLVAFCGNARGNGGDHAALQQQIHGRQRLILRVNNTAVF